MRIALAVDPLPDRWRADREAAHQHPQAGHPTDRTGQYTVIDECFDRLEAEARKAVSWGARWKQRCLLTWFALAIAGLGVVLARLSCKVF
jgi:hypothetical protein